MASYPWQRLLSRPAEEREQIPVAGHITRTVTPLAPEDSLVKALHLFRQEPLPAIPVVDGVHLVGWVTEDRVADHLMAREGPHHTAMVIEVLDPIPAAIEPSTSLTEATQIFRATDEAMLPVITADGVYLGCLLRADVAAAHAGRLAPARIGGMATPLGVYLTTGTVSGGVGDVALMLAGAMMAGIFWLGQMLVMLISAGLYHVTDRIIFRDIVRVIDPYNIYMYPSEQAILLKMLTTFLLLGTFLVLLRFFPWLAGYHAAEHQTVNALESGEPLTPGAVGRMSRVHPRCGTNLWAIIILVNLGLSGLYLAFVTQWGQRNFDWIVSLILPYGVVVFMTWRRLGGWLQHHVTTRPATLAEIESGIRAGEEVLRRHLTAPRVPPTLGQRILKMGLPQVAVGLITTGILLQFLASPLDVWWQTLVK